ncbi:MAG: DUF4259 domain-containing protein [Actinomycetota bacterium]|nr:DUF4259 domain-containing protein [Actinomycetota bacterium]
MSAVGSWGAASFENDTASDWFQLLEEAIDPGMVIASALDEALAEAGHLDLDLSYAAIAAAELSASCAGYPPFRLPEGVERWVSTHPHEPHSAEIAAAVEAVTRVRGESELRDLWLQTPDSQVGAWLEEVNDLIARLGRSGAGDPATLSP